MIILQADREREAGYYWLHHTGRGDLAVAEWTPYEDYGDEFFCGAYWTFMNGNHLYTYEATEWRVVSKIEPPNI